MTVLDREIVPDKKRQAASWMMVSRRLEARLFIILFVVIALVYLTTLYPDQGWGDDFAQYIHQAMNLVQGKSMQETGYIYSRYTPQLGPRVYPPGFPMLLAPVYVLFGLDIRAFQVEIVLLQLVSLLVIYWLYRRDTTRPTALILFIMLGLSPYFVSFKRDIMSDVPFMLFCMAFLLWVDLVYAQQRFTPGSTLVAVLLAFACYLIRTIGLVALAALLLSDLIRYRRPTRFAVWTIAGTFVLILFSRWVFGGGEESYLDQFANYTPQIIIQNIDHYLIKSIRGFWAGPSVTFHAQLIVPILWLLAIPLIIYGFLRRARRSSLLIELFFIFYLATILIWPSVQELRFLYPILPLFLLYAGIGFEGLLEQVRQRADFRVGQSVAVIAALAILSIYTVRTGDVIASEGFLTQGPYTRPALELFDYVSQETAADSIVIFFKPRALSLYANRAASTFPYTASDADAADYLTELGADYAVVKNDEATPNVVLASFIDARPTAFELVFRNQDFRVYRIR